MALRDGTILTGRNAFLDRIWTETIPTGAPGVAVPAAAEGSDTLNQITPTPAPLNIFPWWLYESPGAQDWYISSLNFAVAASTTTAIPGFSFQVSTNSVAVIKQLTMTVQNSLASINLAIVLLMNGQPIIGWSHLVFPPVAATGVIVPFNDMIVRLPENGILTAQAVEASGTNYTCSLQASGWQVSKPEVARLQGNVNY